jgi:hypothetical protein
LVAPVKQQGNNVPIVHVQVVPGVDGSMSIKVHQSKLQEFWGQKDNDFIMANEFVKRVDKIMSAYVWSDKIAFDNFGLALCGSANTWLDSQVILKMISGDRERWTIIRAFFKEEFATEWDNILILDGLAHMVMRPSESIQDFIGHLIKVNSIILDVYKSYTITPPEPIPDANGNVSLVAMRAHTEALIENMGELYLLNQF